MRQRPRELFTCSTAADLSTPASVRVFFSLNLHYLSCFPDGDMDLALRLPHAVRWRIVKASLLKGSVELDATSHPSVLFSHANKFKEDSFFICASCVTGHVLEIMHHISHKKIWITIGMFQITYYHSIFIVCWSVLYIYIPFL